MTVVNVMGLCYWACVTDWRLNVDEYSTKSGVGTLLMKVCLISKALNCKVFVLLLSENCVNEDRTMPVAQNS
jgi:hypothetical protein